MGGQCHCYNPGAPWGRHPRTHLKRRCLSSMESRLSSRCGMCIANTRSTGLAVGGRIGLGFMYHDVQGKQGRPLNRAGQIDHTVLIRLSGMLQ